MAKRKKVTPLEKFRELKRQIMEKANKMMKGKKKTERKKILKKVWRGQV